VSVRARRRGRRALAGARRRVRSPVVIVLGGTGWSAARSGAAASMAVRASRVRGAERNRVSFSAVFDCGRV
jgi:hypothetical protein